MPIQDYPLLGYWLEILENQNVDRTLVNLYHHHSLVEDFISQDNWSININKSLERELLGTAGTLRANYDYFKNSTILLVHADNWSHCDFDAFIRYHLFQKPEGCCMTMMTFKTPNPKSSGIVETNAQGIVQEFHEKSNKPHGNIANAAVYLIDPEILEWINQRDHINDFSTEVIPAFKGRIATWHNSLIHRDIGSFDELRKAQNDDITSFAFKKKARPNWYKNFSSNPIHTMVSNL